MTQAPRKQTIVILASCLCYPPIGGSRIDISGRVDWFLEQGWQIHYVACRTPGKEEEENEREFEVPDIPGFFLSFIRRSSRWLTGAEPSALLELQKIVDTVRPDVIWVEYADLFPLIMGLKSVCGKTVLRCHNFELAHFVEKNVESFSPKRGQPIWTRLRHRLGWLKALVPQLLSIYWIESAGYRAADHVVHIGWEDMKWMRRLYRRYRNVTWVPSFIRQETPATDTAGDVLHILYAGSNFSNTVNVSGARFILNELAPAAERRFGGSVVFHIVGKSGSLLFGGTSLPNVVIHDFVENFEELAVGMNVSIVPLKLGWGCKIKMLHSLANGLPVIGGTATFKGIPYEPAIGFLCRSTGGYLNAILRLKDEGLRGEMAEKGRQHYENWIRESKDELLLILSPQAAMGISHLSAR